MFRLGINGSRIIQSGISDFRTSYEGMAEIDLHKYFIVFEGGYEINDRKESFNYRSEGSFIRVGIDQDLIPYNIHRSVLSFGVRYAFASFEDRISIPVNGLTGPITYREENQNLSATWFEMTLGLRAHVFKNITMGYQIRGKFFKALQGEGELETVDIPGFGRHKKNGKEILRGTVGFDYYIYWTIPFRKKYIPPKPIEP